MSFKNKLSQQELQALYKEWSRADDIKTDLSEPDYMVLVVRYVGRHCKRDEYYFSTRQVAEKCHTFWKARGGIVQLAMLAFVHEYGFKDEPDLHGGA